MVTDAAQLGNVMTLDTTKPFSPLSAVKRITLVRRPVVFLCLVCMGIMLFCIFYLTNANTQSIQSELDLLCADRQSAIQSTMDFVVSSTNVETALYDIYPNQDILTVEFADNYTRYVSQSRAQSYFFDRLAFCQKVLDKDRFYFENVYPKIEILEAIFINDTGGTYVPMNQSFPEYYVWTYGASYATSGREFTSRVGWDIFSYDVFRPDINSSITQNKVWVSRTLNVDQADPFVAIFAPVYNRSFATIPEANRSELCTGIFAGRIYVSNLVEEALIDRDPIPVLIEILDKRNDNNVSFAYFGGQQAFSNYSSAIALDTGYVSVVEIDNGWGWSIRCTATEQYSATHSIVWYWIFLICLAIFTASVMLAVYIQKDLTHLKRVETEVQQRTHELKEAWIRARKMTKLAEKANDQKTKFVSFLCHELRNPLHGKFLMASVVDF
jgi:hypothetical protein